MIGAPIFFTSCTAPPTSECKEFQILHDFKVSGRSITEIGAKISQAHLLHSFQIPKLLNVQRYITERNGACPEKKTFAFSFIDNIISSSSFEVAIIAGLCQRIL